MKTKSLAWGVALLLVGGAAHASYVGGNPLNSIDPMGTNQLVIAGGVKDGSVNVFGHVANAVTGAGVFSYGNSTDLGSGVQAYIQSQIAVRNQVVTFIPTSPAQDQAALAFYALHPGRNSVGIFDNCATRTNQALNAAGVPTQDIPFPGGLSRDVSGLPGTQQFFIPQGGPIPQGLMNLLPGFEPH
jgi:hypothetical protein